MGAEANVIKKADMGKVRELDFAQLFGENIKGLVKMLGVTRMIPVTEIIISNNRLKKCLYISAY